jgi:hypothetical protein
MIIQSNSQIFTNDVLGTGTDQTATQLVDKNVSTQETYLSSSSFSNMSTELPKIPSNQRVAKD